MPHKSVANWKRTGIHDRVEGGQKLGQRCCSRVIYLEEWVFVLQGGCKGQGRGSDCSNSCREGGKLQERERIYDGCGLCTNDQCSTIPPPPPLINFF